jgi:hypothetical protein
VSARCVGTYRFAVTGFTRSQPQPSARFPWFNHRSRNRSPPIELCGKHGTFCRTRPYTYNSREPTWIPGWLGTADAVRPEAGPRRRSGASGARARVKMAPASAGGGRNAPAGADRQGRSRSTGRVSPEMRPEPLTLTGPQPPERTPVTAKDARERRHGCLLSATPGYIFITQRY